MSKFKELSQEDKEAQAFSTFFFVIFLPQRRPQRRRDRCDELYGWLDGWAMLFDGEGSERCDCSFADDEDTTPRT